MTTFTTEDRLDAEKLTQATVVITAKGNDVEVHTEGEGQALYIANLMVNLVDQKVKGNV
jgi:fructose-specific phosphotransferase system component IIB